MNKGLIILGSAASGKSTLIKELEDTLFLGKNINNLNSDFWVEDPESKYFNNPLKASKHLYENILPFTMDLGNDFILDTTGSNINTLRKITEYPNYQFKAVVVYVNPIIAFIRNFSRERKLPKQVLLENWLKVYSQLDDYRELFEKDNIYILETEYSEEEIQHIKNWDTTKINFNEFGLHELYYYLETFDYFLDTNSSFRKETTKYTPQEIQLKLEKFKEVCEKVQTRSEFTQPIFTKKQDIIRELKEWI